MESEPAPAPTNSVLSLEAEQTSVALFKHLGAVLIWLLQR